MSELNETIAVPRQCEITIRIDEDYINIHQEDLSGEGCHSDIEVHRSTLAALIVTLRRIDGQEA